MGAAVEGARSGPLSDDGAAMLQVDVSAGETLFAADLVAALARTAGNLVVSPANVYDALARLAPGARGATADALMGAMHSAVPASALLAGVAQLGRELNSDDAALRIAAAAWLQDGFDVVDAYRSLLAETGSPLRRADFAHDSEAGRAAINAWIEENTAGHIRNLVGPGAITVQTVLVLASAIALDAKWQRPFRDGETEDAPFRSPAGTRSVPTMHLSASLQYADAGDLRAVRLGYAGGRLGALIVLAADAAGDPLSVLPRLSASEVREGFDWTPVKLALPRFEVAHEIDLCEPLAALGLGSLYGTPDLSGIAGAPGLLRVDVAKHRAWLSVDEVGTKGAAATYVAMLSSARVHTREPVDFIVDRPFLFVVEDIAHRVPLFVARIVDPST